MEFREIRNKLIELFEGWEVLENDGMWIYFIKNDIEINIYNHHTYFVFDRIKDEMIYEDQTYIRPDDVDYEKMLDEIVVFKELILPKYI